MDLEAGAYYFEQIYEILQRKLKKMPESWEPVKLSGCEVVKFDPWDAEQLLFSCLCSKVTALLIGENGNGFFGTSSTPVSLSFKS